jgi:hypothetical protein
MMALELLDTKGQGGNSARPGAAKADLSAARMPPDRSGIVPPGDDVGCPVMHRSGKTMKSPRDRVLKHPSAVPAPKVPNHERLAVQRRRCRPLRLLERVAVPSLRSAASTVTSSSSYIVRTTAGVDAQFVGPNAAIRDDRIWVLLRCTGRGQAGSANVDQDGWIWAPQ